MGTKISIELPEWAEERHIYIFAGSELLGVKWADKKKLLVKTDRCNNCGHCCYVLSKTGKFRFPVKDNHCAHLIIYEDGETYCDMGLDVPFSCCFGDPTLHDWVDKEKCSIKYKEESIN